MAARWTRCTSALALCLAFAGDAAAFDVQGHRGARGRAPENTLAAFRKAIELGVSTIETDVAVTRDDVVVISHDPYLNPALVRDRDGRWLREPGPAIRTLTFDELPTLDAVLALAKQASVRVNIETKITPTSGERTPNAETFARLVVERVRAASMIERVTIQSFDWRTLVAVKSMAPDIATGCLTAEGGRFDTVRV